jgi:lambda repressor-like predicted transcriptional regulator
MVLALSLLVTGCVQKSEMDKAVADVTAKLKTSDDAAKKNKTDLDKASADLAAAKKDADAQKAIVAKFTTEVAVWAPKDGKLASSKVRTTVESKPEGLMENALNEVLAALKIKDAKLEKVAIKADTATVTLSKEARTNWPKEEKDQKLAVGAIVNTLSEFKDVKKVMVTTITGGLKVGKTNITKALVKDDPLFKI